MICKDKLKEVIWDRVRYDTTERTNSQKYGGLAYDISFHFCEMLMKIDQPIVFESNFVDFSWEVLQPMIVEYDYRVINVLFDGDSEVIHKRFLERDKAIERHSGLVSNGHFEDLNVFKNAVQGCRDFKYGDVLIHVDATDFKKVCYDETIKEIKAEIIKGG